MTVETIVRVGASGVSITLYGERRDDRWVFSLSVNDQTPELINEEALHHESSLVDSWESALKLLDEYPWYRLVPLSVHPEFRDAIREAVKERHAVRGTRYLRDWLAM